MRRIGARIKTVCTVMERLGPISCTEIARLESIEPENVRIYCKRAELHGLAVADRTVRPITYTVIEGWLKKIEKPARIRRPKKEPPSLGCNFVFNLGAHV